MSRIVLDGSDGRCPYSTSNIAIIFKIEKKSKSRFCDQIARRSCAMKNTSYRDHITPIGNCTI